VKRITGVSLLLMAMLSGAFFYTRFRTTPPRESVLIANFQTHRAAYERLREMLQDDRQLLRVASWGVETTKSVSPHMPPEGDFPVVRYNEYLALLREVGGLGASRGRGEHPDSVCVMM
jgi:hypothetical protein